MNHMKIAIRSAGKGQRADYTWKSNSDCSGEIRFLESMCGQGHGFTLVRRNGMFNAYFSGFKTGLVDYQQRNIVVALVLLDVSENTTRSLSLLFMEDYARFKEILLDAVSRPSADKWTVDYDKVTGLVEEAEKQANLNLQATPFDAPRADDFDGKADSNEQENTKHQRNIKRLCQEIREHRFSDGDGLKLLVAATPPQAGYEKAKEEADRLLWAEGSNDDLVAFRKKKEKPQKKSSQPAKSGELSSPPSVPSFGKCLLDFLLLEPAPPNSSNPTGRISPKKLSIIFAVAGLLIVVLAIGSKKKVLIEASDEPVLITPAQPAEETTHPQPSPASTPDSSQ